MTDPKPSDKNPPALVPAPLPAKPPVHERIKAAGKIVAILVVCIAVLLILSVWGIIERHPRTDDATLRANVVGIVPRVSGQIVNIDVQDNQAVKAGDPLFEIDPDDYQIALEKAQAALGALDQQIKVARAEDAQLKFAAKAAQAAVNAANFQLQQAKDSLSRLQPLLSKGYATAEQVETAQTAKQVAASTVATEEQRLNQASAALSTLDTLLAQRPGAVASVHLATLELSYTKVTAPFPGRVIALNLSPGAYASMGIPVFSLLDTRHWYVIANFREGELPHIAPGMNAEVYLLSAPDRRYHAKVQGIGWAVEPEDEIDLPHSLPYVKRELNWVHVAQRFPVRLEVTDPNPDLFRMGASADAIIQASQ